MALHGAAFSVLLGLIGGCASGSAGSTGALRSPEAVAQSCGDVSECESACEAGDGAACHAAGTRYELGLGIDQSHRQAASLYDRGCELGAAGACNNLGVLHEIGLGVEQSDDRAAELYERACRGGDPLGCENERRSVRRK